MTEPIRSDFWKCVALLPVGKDEDGDPSYTHCLRINPAGHSCKCGNDPSESPDERDFPPVTNRELLAHWLLADDDRRKEIEIASRPKEAGQHVAHELGVPAGTLGRWDLMVTFENGEPKATTILADIVFTREEMDAMNWLWEKL